MDRFKVGVVGVGDSSDVYLDNPKRYDDIVEVIGCASRSAERARTKAQLHGLRKAYASVDELMADPEVDIVLDLTTPDAHARLDPAALEAGKHVYSEKPLAATFAESRTILEAANETGHSVGSAPDTFLGGRLQTFRKLLDAGELGDIVGASALCVSHGWQWFHPDPDFFHQPGAGPLLDIGPYHVTALLSLLGRRSAAAPWPRGTPPSGPSTASPGAVRPSTSTSRPMSADRSSSPPVRSRPCS